MISSERSSGDGEQDALRFRCMGRKPGDGDEDEDELREGEQRFALADVGENISMVPVVYSSTSSA